MKILNERDTVKRIIVTVLASMALTALYAVIFRFSDQNAEQSGSLSMRISENVVGILNSLAGKRWSQQFMEDLAAYFEHPVRKLAHFGEYTCVGILVYLIWIPWIKRGKGFYALVTVWVFISGACDEFHQLFVPGRWGSLADVCLDTCGGIFGLLLCVLISRVRNNKAIKKKAGVM